MKVLGNAWNLLGRVGYHSEASVDLPKGKFRLGRSAMHGSRMARRVLRLGMPGMLLDSRAGLLQLRYKLIRTFPATMMIVGQLNLKGKVPFLPSATGLHCATHIVTTGALNRHQ